MTIDSVYKEVLSSWPELNSSAKEMFDRFQNETASVSGECNDAFNPILGSGPFSLATPPVVLWPVDKILVTAAVLQRIASEPTRQIHGVMQTVGWKGMNQDAKGWCKNLLDALPGQDWDPGDLQKLLIAKGLVGTFVPIELDCSEERDVPDPAKPGTIENYPDEC